MLPGCLASVGRGSLILGVSARRLRGPALSSSVLSCSASVEKALILASIPARRSSNCLKSGDITTIGQVVCLSKNQLMKLKNFGKKSLDEIREKLMEHNLSLRDEGDDNEPEQEEQDET